MNDIFEVLTKASPTLLVTIAAVYFLKVFLEKRIEGLAGQVEDIAKTSLEVKKDLRGEERSELVAFRVAVEEWENFLQTSLFDFTMLPPSKALVESFYEKDKELFLKVKIAVVRVGIYLRDQELEQRLMAAVVQLRTAYYPIINSHLPQLIELQSRLLPIEQKLAAFVQSGLSDARFAPTPQDRDEQNAVQAKLTEEMRRLLGNPGQGISQDRESTGGAERRHQSVHLPADREGRHQRILSDATRSARPSSAARISCRRPSGRSAPPRRSSAPLPPRADRRPTE